MSYLNILESERKNREKYEKEDLLLRTAITECNSLYSLHDGDFLEKLQEFIKQYKDEKQQNQTTN